jgi:hypothetical protein|tara:strand:- start:1567 stop:1869 length:303 start_codon:yes stop_codon:yes gene_type:complete
MDEKDKKPSVTKDVSEVFATNITEVDFKSGTSGDIIKTIGPETEAVLITYERDKGELKLYHNGLEVDKAVFARVVKAETGFYSLLDFIQDKFKSWRTAWM